MSPNFYMIKCRFGDKWCGCVFCGLCTKTTSRHLTLIESLKSIKPVRNLFFFVRIIFYYCLEVFFCIAAGTETNGKKLFFFIIINISKQYKSIYNPKI